MGSADSAKSHQSIELSRSASASVVASKTALSMDSDDSIKSETTTASNESEGNLHHSEAQDAVISPPQLTSECGLLQYEVDALYASYSRAMVTNYNVLIGGTDGIIHVGADAHWAVDSSFSGSPSEEDRQSACCFETQRSSILLDISKVSTTAEVVDLIQRQINACNIQFTQRWSLLLSAVKRSMPGIRLLLRAKYLARMHSFWRRQMLVHTKR
jgi:hypothetical protein